MRNEKRSGQRGMDGTIVGRPRDGRSGDSTCTGQDSGSIPPPHVLKGRGPARPKRGRSALARSASSARLYTATVFHSDGSVLLQAFHASVAFHPAQVIQRLRTRFGDEVLHLAELREGFHPAMPVVVALVPDPVADMIRQTERSCTRPEASSFVVDIEQRIEI